MEIVSIGPLPVASVVWQPMPRAFMLTVVCRATFQLAPGECALAAAQEPPSAVDVHWNGDAARSLSAPSDLAPLKLRADVILVGSAFAPRGEQVRSVIARLQVGEIDKSIEVFGERSFSQDGVPMEGPRFARMPLWWERAAGGPETINPVGMRLDARDSYGWTPIPNLQPVGLSIARPGDPLPPIGFGPIAPSWPTRRERLGHRAGTWPGARWMDEPLPSDIDAAYFNSAPRDQQVDQIRDDERLVLENLHPHHPQLVTTLPALRPRARAERRGGVEEEVPLRADTLWIDTDRGLCTLTWRGRVRIEHPGEIGRVVIDSGPAGARGAARPPGGAVPHTLLPGAALAALAAPLPFLASRPELSPMARPGAFSEPARGAFDPGETVAPMMADAVELRRAMPFGGVPAAPRSSPSMLAAPPMLVRPPEPTAPPIEMPAWSPAPGPVVAPPQISREPSFGEGPNGVLASSEKAASIDRRPRELAEIDDEPTPLPAASEPRARVAPQEAVKLVWFDAAVLPRIRRQGEWRGLLTDLELRLIDEAAADLAAGPLAPEAKDRRTVLEVLLRGAAISADGVKPAVDAALRDDGGFEPPLALLAAELEMPFDELETLKAISAAARPLVSTDKRLKEAVDQVDELLASPWLSGAGGTAESLTTKVREAFAQAKRTLAPDYLEVQAERRLLDQRAYQARPVFGKKHLRSLIRGATGTIPVYLPEATKDELPMFRRFRVKMLVELDHREDQGEASPWSIKVLALGRVFVPGT
jgi:hypothetical protein